MKVFKFYEKLLKGELLDLPTPTNLNFWFGLGVSLGVVYIMQVVSGVVLSFYYSVGLSGGFWPVVGIMQDVWGGWFVRFTHSSGASIFMLLIYLHLLRGFLYGSFKKTGVWISGVFVMLVVMGVSFLGYVLPWGSMSYWGMTVVISMLGAIPLVGETIMEALWGGPTAGVHSLSRFFSLHYMSSLVVMVVVVVHLIELHRKGSSNPLGVTSDLDKVVFMGLFVIKDVLGLLYLLLLYWVVVLVCPYSLMDAANFEEVSFVVTPTHIKPEWYFLFAYCILRAVPSKLGGVALMFLSVLIMLIFGFSRGVSPYRAIGGWLYKGLMVSWVSVFLLLTWLGGSSAETPYDTLGQVFTVAYFLALMGMFTVLIVDVESSRW
uniref:Cytochrome b n=2 Tax=Pomphorhynchus TaxID=60542 RepID=A0A806GME7_9BILA|nr:cytochrome b [Pomphorhynchus laevis]AFI44250.1 cytochrome b [Pomphorhynchus laevis]AFJ14755.1 cytochrome b [Pomphorhynchus tereticollis]AFJ14767.1 cytochrome b [Pomphorhynchus tereticollis]